MVRPGADGDNVLEINLVRLVVVLLAATNTDRCIAVGQHLARAEDAAAPLCGGGS